tara:strand:+ start:37 stop:231 length:195 start_codon:yes stop_codon:yes gene_type:complete
MNIIKLILGIQACIAGALVIVWLLGSLAMMGMELEFMAEDYAYMQEMNAQMMEGIVDESKKESY